MADLIDRQAAIKAIENLQDCYNGFSDTYDKACIVGALEELPSAQPDTSTVMYGLGKWIEKEDDGYHGGGYTECSVCGQRYSWGGYFEANGFRYCPRCGHRMEEQE